MDGEAQKAGVEVRRYAAKPVMAKEYYSEVPFDMELDGPYYSMLNFFDRVGKLERIVNISGLLVSTTKTPSNAKVKHNTNTHRTRVWWHRLLRRHSLVTTWRRPQAGPGTGPQRRTQA